MQKKLKSRFFHITKNLLNPKKNHVIFKKIITRIYDERVNISDSEYNDWLNLHGIEFSEWGQKLSPKTYKESITFAEKFYAIASNKLKENDFDMGGGALVHILYFLTRKFRPRTIVETGVASGYSSETFLQALHKNGQNGKLYSSDFPYFRVAHPEKYIGQLVSDHLRNKWKLFTEGDEKNLVKILKEINSIDLFHYDSDKSIRGRNKVFNKIKKFLSTNSIVMFDDINNNPHFLYLIRKYSINNFIVIKHKGACVAGIIFWSNEYNE